MSGAGAQGHSLGAHLLPKGEVRLGAPTARGIRLQFSLLKWDLRGLVMGNTGRL